MTKLILIPLFGLFTVSCTSSPKTATHSPTNASFTKPAVARKPASGNLFYESECSLVYADEMRGLFTPERKDEPFQPFSLSAYEVIKARPNSWANVDAKQVPVLIEILRSLYDGKISACTEHARESYEKYLGAREYFLNSVAYDVSEKRPKAIKERSFLQSTRPNEQEMNLVDAAQFLANSLPSSPYERVDPEYQKEFVAKFTGNDIKCLRTKESYKVYKKYDNRGHTVDPQGPLVYCYIAHKRDFGVEGAGSDWATEQSGLLFWDLSEKDLKEFLTESRGHYDNLVLGTYVDIIRN